MAYETPGTLPHEPLDRIRGVYQRAMTGKSRKAGVAADRSWRPNVPSSGIGSKAAPQRPARKRVRGTRGGYIAGEGKQEQRRPL